MLVFEATLELEKAESLAELSLWAWNENYLRVYAYLKKIHHKGDCGDSVLVMNEYLVELHDDWLLKDANAN